MACNVNKDGNVWDRSTAPVLREFGFCEGPVWKGFTCNYMSYFRPLAMLYDDITASPHSPPLCPIEGLRGVLHKTYDCCIVDIVQ